MKKIWQMIFVLVLTIACFSLYCVLSQRRPWEVACPGIQDEKLEHLDTRIAKQIRDIILILEKENRPFEISSVYRSPQKQLCYYRISRVISKRAIQRGPSMIWAGIQDIYK